MNTLSSFFHRASKDSKQNIFAHALRIAREHAIAIGMCMTVLLCAGVLLFDGVIFYTDVVRPRAPVTGNEKKINLSEKEVTDTLMLVDDRQKEFNDILNSLGGPGNAASSTELRSSQPPSKIEKPRIRR